MFSCGDSGPDCGFEDGVYTVQYRKLNGDCPDIALSLVSPKSAPSDCSLTFTYDDKCAVNMVRECERGDIYGRYILDLEPRGPDYIGLYQILGPMCHGLYDVTYITQ